MLDEGLVIHDVGRTVLNMKPIVVEHREIIMRDTLTE